MRNVLALLMVVLLIAAVAASPASAGDESVVNVVLLWMEGCPHCHDVLDNVLPPLQQEYGDQLNILLVELETIEDTEQLYRLGESAGLSKDQIGVPFLIIGGDVLVGSDQIHAHLANLLETYLAAGGAAIPAIPALLPFLPAGTETVDPSNTAAVLSLPEAENGYALAVVVLVGLVLSLGYTAVTLWRARQGVPAAEPAGWIQSALPVLAVAGLVVAGYLAYVETQAVTAVCGPVGDCNAVQTSAFAYLFGVPIGVLGVAGYLAILAVWAWGRWRANEKATLLVLGMSILGVLSSIYLTFLELFVIGAVCAWCLASAVLMALILLVSVRTAVPLLRRLPLA